MLNLLIKTYDPCTKNLKNLKNFSTVWTLKHVRQRSDIKFLSCTAAYGLVKFIKTLLKLLKMIQLKEVELVLIGKMTFCGNDEKSSNLLFYPFL